MSDSNQPHSLTLNGHTIDCSRAIYNDCKKVFSAEDDQKLGIVAKRVYTNDATQLQCDFEKAQNLSTQHVLRPIRLLRESN